MDPNTESSPLHFLVHTMHRLWTSGNYMLWVSLGFSQLPGCLTTRSPQRFQTICHPNCISCSNHLVKISQWQNKRVFFTKPSLFDRFTLFRTEMTKTETRGISSAKWILLSVIDYCFWRMLICQNLPYANRQFYFNVLLVLFVSFALSFPSIFLAHFPVFLSSKGENLTWTE